MSPRLALDLHAHVDVDIDAAELSVLGVVFAVTRSLDEAEQAMRRADQLTVWGAGCHPGLLAAQRDFSLAHFERLVEQTAFVSEVGLDGGSPVPMAVQSQTLDSILAVLQRSPRITSIHSSDARTAILDSLETTPIRGAVLHWWRGDVKETQRALELGCYFSVNHAGLRDREMLRLIPIERLLTETDHPFGDRRSGGEGRPGLVSSVEVALAHAHGMRADEIRMAVWSNLATLVGETGCAGLLPRDIRRALLAS